MDNLHCPAIGGTTFLVDNNIKQDFQHNQVSLLGNKSTVPSTHKEALMPISNQYTHAQHNSIHTHNTQTSTAAEQPVGINCHAAAAGTADSLVGIHRHAAVNPLISLKTKRILMPGDHLTLQTNLPDQQILVEANQPTKWPPPTLATICNQSLSITNTTNKPVYIDNKHTHSIKLTLTTVVDTTIQLQWILWTTPMQTKLVNITAS